MDVGRRIYYDVTTGEILVDTGEKSGEYIFKLTEEQDIELFTILAERNRESFDFIDLEYGEFYNDFMGCNGYRVKPQTKELVFSYPDPNEPEALPVFRKPLSEEVEELKIAQAETNTNLLEFMEAVLLS